MCSKSVSCGCFGFARLTTAARSRQSYILNGVLNIAFAGFLFVQLPTHLAGILMICSGLMYFVAAYRKERKRSTSRPSVPPLTTRLPAASLTMEQVIETL